MILGAVSLFFPTEYEGNLYTLNAGCSLEGFTSVAECKFGAFNRIDIQMNGEALSALSLYTLKISKLNNPANRGLFF